MSQEVLLVNLQTTTEGMQDVTLIVEVHHIIIALENCPNWPSPVPEGWIGPPLDVFDQIG
jgi:exportin-T